MEIVYVVSDGQIIHLPAAVVGQAESESSISVPYIRNHHHYPLKFQQGFY
jgi:hypothetical protein